MIPFSSPETPRNTARDKKDGTPTKAKATPDKQIKGKPKDFGKAIGIDKPANIRDKISRWQTEQAQQDGEDVATEEVVTPPVIKTKVEPTPPKPKDFGKAIGIKKPANVRAKISKWQAEQAQQDAEDSGIDDRIVDPPADETNIEPPTTPKPKNLGKAIGIDKPANIRDKISKWQAEQAQQDGEDSGIENKIVSPPGADTKVEPSPKVCTTPKAKPLGEQQSPKPVYTPTKVVPVLLEKPKSAKKPAHNKLDDDIRNASAPKKRVVSDSNWQKKKAQEKESTPKRTEPKPLPPPTAWVRPARRMSQSKPKPAPGKLDQKPFVIYTPKKPGNGEQPKSHSATSPQPKEPGLLSPDQPERRNSTDVENTPKKIKSGDSPFLASPFSPKSPNSPKAKVEVVRVRRRPKQTSPRGSISADDWTPVKPASVPKTNSSSREDFEDEFKGNRTPQRGAGADSNDRPRRRSTHKREPSYTDTEEVKQERRSSARRRLRRKSDEPSTDIEALPQSTPAEPGPPQRVFGTRVEAWLTSTPDPFLDSDSGTRRRSKESISTLELPDEKLSKSGGKRYYGRKSSPPQEKERSEPERRPSRNRRATLHVDTRSVDEKESIATSSDLVDSIASSKDGDLTPSATLKRRGARRKSQHSPLKDRFKSPPPEDKPVQQEESVISDLSSSVDVPILEPEERFSKSRPENPALRRIFPSTGKRLSTIASVETFNTKFQEAPPSIAIGSEAGQLAEHEKGITASESSDQFQSDTITTLSRRSTKRRLASHSDLMSVLSMPKEGAKSIVSARSIRTNRSRLATATIRDVMRELTSDEAKYMRELRTLVDGVVPVLLSCVLSKSDSAVAAGLFSPAAAKTDPSSVTKPIIEMGVALERLKGFHKRITTDDPDQFLSWAQSAQRVYSEYIRCWRLGFQDVVVSLAPADEDPTSTTPGKTVNAPDGSTAWDQGLPRNEEGYVVNGDGELVDVAYMLKRPLVRLKYLSKSIRAICHVKPSELAEKMSAEYQNLVEQARRRSNEERSRMEDEAAAAIDPTRARDPRSLAPLAGVRIDPSRCVRARDFFDMHLIHSSGQEVACRVELLLRDDAVDMATQGDVLICEVDATARWLFFPPIQRSRISARRGDGKGEIVVMLRGYSADGAEWSEILSLKTDDEMAALEWMQMLGTVPVPPQLGELNRKSSLDKTPRPTSSRASSSLVSAATASTPPRHSRTPSPHEIEIPIGEQAHAASKKWGYDTPEKGYKSREASPITPPSTEHSTLNFNAGGATVSTPLKAETNLQAEREVHTSRGTPTSRDGGSSHERTPRNLNEAMNMAGSGSPVGLKRTRAKRVARNSPQPSAPSRPSRQITLDDPLPEEEQKQFRKASKHRKEQSSSLSSPLTPPSKGFSVWIPSSDVGSSDSSGSSDDEDYALGSELSGHSFEQPTGRRSPVPSMDLPTIPKLRKPSQPSTPIQEPSRKEHVEVKEAPASAPPKLQSKATEPIAEPVKSLDEDDKPPPVPPHRSPSPASPVTLKGSKTPVFTPGLPGHRVRRRSSSPLKHEYEPSTATESSSESEDLSDEDESSESEFSDDELEDDVPTPLRPVAQLKGPKVSPPPSIYTLPNGTITPSQSASNTPYRSVPKVPGKTTKSVATISSWSDSGKWEPLHPDECSIVVVPGKLEVYELSPEHSRPLVADGDEIMQSDGRAPLISLHLTPLVLIRKGTAIDISIRSRPAPESRIQKGSNFMLRSRNPAECAELYNMINQSRMNNPTYNALQNARATSYGQSNWAQAMDRQNAARSAAGSSSSWFNFGGTLGRRRSYRSSSTRAVSVSAATESSVGTMNTAFRSALNRFTFGKGRFNLGSSRDGASRSTNSYDSGSNSNGSGSGSGTNTPSNIDPTAAPGAPAGITSMKVRLYERETLSKWREIGSGRLSIMLPDPAEHTLMRQGKGSPGVRDLSQEKRIQVLGKRGETLLDVTLGESCFEHVGRLGIAVSVWEDVVGEDGEVGRVGAVGGVTGARARTFMIQMKNYGQCAYAFSLLGKQRY